MNYGPREMESLLGGSSANVGAAGQTGHFKNHFALSIESSRQRLIEIVNETNSDRRQCNIFFLLL